MCVLCSMTDQIDIISARFSHFNPFLVEIVDEFNQYQILQVMDMEHELRALRIQLAQKSKHSLLLQKEVCLLLFVLQSQLISFFQPFQQLNESSQSFRLFLDLPKVFLCGTMLGQNLHFFFTFHSIQHIAMYFSVGTLFGTEKLANSMHLWYNSLICSSSGFSILRLRGSYVWGSDAYFKCLNQFRCVCHRHELQ